MPKAKSLPAGTHGTIAPARIKAGKTPAREPRAPVQVLRSTKHWLDQIVEEKQFRTYDEAIMFLITERQRHLPSDSGVFSDMAGYVCDGED